MSRLHSKNLGVAMRWDEDGKRWDEKGTKLKSIKKPDPSYRKIAMGVWMPAGIGMSFCVLSYFHFIE